MGYGKCIWARDWDAITAAARLQPKAEISPERPIVGFLIDIEGTISTARGVATNVAAVCGLLAAITAARVIDNKEHNYLEGIDGLDLWQIHRHFFHVNPYTDLTLGAAAGHWVRCIIPLTLPTGMGDFKVDFTFGAFTLVGSTLASVAGFSLHLYTIYGSKLEGVQEYIAHEEVYTGATRDTFPLPVNGRLDAMLIQTYDGTPNRSDTIVSDIEVTDGGIPQCSGILEDMRGWGEAYMEQGYYALNTTHLDWFHDPVGIFFLNFDNFTPDLTARCKYTVTAAGTARFLLKYTQPQMEVTSQIVPPATAADKMQQSVNQGEMSRDVVRAPKGANNQTVGINTDPQPEAVYASGPVSGNRRRYSG